MVMEPVSIQLNQNVAIGTNFFLSRSDLVKVVFLSGCHHLILSEVIKIYPIY